jgi:hypothetical protein
MIKSETYKGRIYSGDTKLALSIAITQSNAMQLTVSAGSFTTTGDKRLGIASQTYVLTSDRVIPIMADAVKEKVYRVEFGLDNGVVEVLAQARFSLDDWQPYPQGWVTVHPLVFDFIVPPNTVSLDAIDIFVLTVKSGFPAGTTAADWQVQHG